MKVRIQSPMATMTAELTTEQALAIYGQVLEWLSETEEDLSEEETIEDETTEEDPVAADEEVSWVPPERPDNDPFLSAANQDRLTKTIEAYETEQSEALSIPLPESDTPLKPQKKGYYGFLYIRCEHCGEIKGFYTKRPLTAYHCDCGHDTELENLKVAEVFCRCCEHSFKYRTNIQDYNFVIECLECKAPVDMILHKTKTKYIALDSVKW